MKERKIKLRPPIVEVSSVAEGDGIDSKCRRCGGLIEFRFWGAEVKLEYGIPMICDSCFEWRLSERGLTPSL